MKIIFFGSDDFALTNLDALLQTTHEVVACVTQPDRPKGRGLQVVSSPIKERAEQKKLPLFQPASVREPEFIEALKIFQADLFIVVAYGQILPLEVLAIPYVCCINVHASLLPKYRGAAPVNWVILNGESETGVTIMKMNSKMDAGDMFLQVKAAIDPQENSQQLRDRLAQLGAQALVRVVNSLEKNEYTLTAQDHRQATLAPKLTRDLGIIEWTQDAAQITNKIRGLIPWPGATTVWQGKTLKITVAALEPKATQHHALPGEVIAIPADGLIVAARTGCVKLLKVQPESGKEMDARSFAVGFRLKAGDRLGI